MTNIETNKLALFGGPKTIKKVFAPYNSLGEEERLAVDEVMRTGILSKFLGTWHKDFYGGSKVQEFEKVVQHQHQNQGPKMQWQLILPLYHVHLDPFLLPTFWVFYPFYL